MSQSVAPERSRPASLWRDPNFLTLWSGQALSQFGSQITELAIPVLAVLSCLVLLTRQEPQHWLLAGVLLAVGVLVYLVTRRSSRVPVAAE